MAPASTRTRAPVASTAWSEWEFSKYLANKDYKNYSTGQEQGYDDAFEIFKNEVNTASKEKLEQLKGTRLPLWMHKRYLGYSKSRVSPTMALINQPDAEKIREFILKRIAEPARKAKKEAERKAKEKAERKAKEKAEKEIEL
jgi:hypothetical protein